jgi:hypothetical protein
VIGLALQHCAAAWDVQLHVTEPCLTWDEGSPPSCGFSTGGRDAGESRSVMNRRPVQGRPGALLQVE